VWSGEMSQSAHAILHQHAVQGDISDAQHAIWRVIHSLLALALTRLLYNLCISFHGIFKIILLVGQRCSKLLVRSGEGRRYPSPYGVWGYASRKNVEKSALKLHIFVTKNVHFQR